MHLDAAKTGYRGSITHGAEWLLSLLCSAAIGLYAFAPERDELPAAVVAFVAFFAVQVLFPKVRLRLDVLLCPSNIAVFLFGMQLVLLPLLCIYSGFSRGTLPGLPSADARNAALLLTVLAYAAFSISYSAAKARASQPELPARVAHGDYILVYPRAILVLVLIFAVIGLLGFYLYYGSWNQYLSYLTIPSMRVAMMDTLSGTLEGAASTFFRPFLGFAFALAWSLWIDGHGRSFAWPVKAAATVFVATLIFFVNIGFNYNRGSVMVPILALAAAFSIRVRRIPLTFLLITLSILLSIFLVWGVYRSSDLEMSDLGREGVVSSIMASASVVDILEVYGGAPQFSGFVLEGTGFGREPSLGKTLLASLLFPIPVLGKSFRPASGVELYNRLIYGNQAIADQIIPFQAELFINFHVFGVILGYALLGLFVAQFQQAFDGAANTFETYAFFIMSFWTAFLIPWSLAVFSQMYIYTFWPIYVYLIIKRLVPQTSATPRSIGL